MNKSARFFAGVLIARQSHDAPVFVAAKLHANPGHAARTRRCGVEVKHANRPAGISLRIARFALVNLHRNLRLVINGSGELFARVGARQRRQRWNNRLDDGLFLAHRCHAQRVRQNVVDLHLVERVVAAQHRGLKRGAFGDALVGIVQ